MLKTRQNRGQVFKSLLGGFPEFLGLGMLFLVMMNSRESANRSPCKSVRVQASR